MGMEMHKKEVDIPALNKKVVLTIHQDTPAALTEAFNFVAGLLARDQLRDLEAGFNPQHPTHEIVKKDDNRYHLNRLRF